LYNYDFLESAGLRGQYGDPIILKGKISIEINPRYFAAKMIKSHNLIFFKNPGWHEWSSDGWVPVRECILQSRIADLLQEELRATFRLQKKAAQYSNRPVANFGGVSIGEAGPSAPAYDLINTRTIGEILRTMRYMSDRGDNFPPLDPDVIPVQNGLLRFNAEMHDFEFRAYTQDDMVFYTLDVVYDSGAKSELFDKVLSDILPDPEDRRVVQMYMGASLFSQNLTRKFMSFTGEGGSGKSVLLGLFSKIMTPARNFDLEIKDLTSDFGLSALTTQTLITVSEAGKDEFCKGSGAAADFIKKFVGRDFFQTKRKNRNEKYNHEGVFSVIYVSNHPLKFEFESDGEEFRSRLLPILFNKRIENPNLTLGDELLLPENRSAFFLWVLEGARLVRRSNWQIELSKEQVNRREKIIQATRGIELFVKNYIEKFETGYITTEEAYKKYDKLRRTDGYTFYHEGKFDKRLSEVMSDFGGEKDKNLPSANGKKNARGYRGVRWKDVNELK